MMVFLNSFSFYLLQKIRKGIVKLFLLPKFKHWWTFKNRNLLFTTFMNFTWIDDIKPNFHNQKSIDYVYIINIRLTLCKKNSFKQRTPKILAQ